MCQKITCRTALRCNLTHFTLVNKWKIPNCNNYSLGNCQLQPWNNYERSKSTPSSIYAVPTIWFAFKRVKNGKLHFTPLRGSMNTLSCHMAYPTHRPYSNLSLMRCSGTFFINVSLLTLMISWFIPTVWRTMSIMSKNSCLFSSKTRGKMWVPCAQK